MVPKKMGLSLLVGERAGASAGTEKHHGLGVCSVACGLFWRGGHQAGLMFGPAECY